MGWTRYARQGVNRLLHPLGWDLSRYGSRHEPAAVRGALLQARSVDLVIDVGANVGQYGQRLRETGYGGRIVSIEPLSMAFDQLKRTAARDPHWLPLQTAVGRLSGEMTINIPAEDVASSLLPMEAGTQQLIGSYVNQEKIHIERLDTVLAGLLGQRTFLKIDVQGYERAVLEGAERILEQCVGVEIELSLAPIYVGQTLWREDIDYLEARGFRLVNLTPGFRGATGELLQFDGLFVHDESPEFGSARRKESLGAGFA